MMYECRLFDSPSVSFSVSRISKLAVSISMVVIVTTSMIVTLILSAFSIAFCTIELSVLTFSSFSCWVVDCFIGKFRYCFVCAIPFGSMVVLSCSVGAAIVSEDPRGYFSDWVARI